jgi:signal transduction histidine kinase
MADTPRTLGEVLVTALRRIERSDWWWIAVSLLLWLVLIVLQTWDVRGRLGPAGAAELVGVIVGTGGILLFGAVRLLERQAMTRSVRSSTGASDLPEEVILALPVLAAGAVGCFGVTIALEALRILILRAFFPAIIVIVLVGVFAWYALQLVASTTRGLYEVARLKAERAARAETEASEARLAALQAQMNPHFLFNALNTVASLVRTDAVRAERAVENLAGVLRQTLRRSAHTMTTVDDEAGYVRAYLEVERERLGPRLQVTMAIEDATRACRIPTMSLQPLVENALTHAVGTRLEGGSIRVSARAAGARLVLTVDDTGGGFPAGYAPGTGLSNLRQRLQTIYGDAAQLVIASSDAGARVTIDLPKA